MTSEIAAIFAALALGVALGYIIGARGAYKRGRDEQWIEDFFAREERKRESRDEAGRFKRKERK